MNNEECFDRCWPEEEQAAYEAAQFESDLASLREWMRSMSSQGSAKQIGALKLALGKRLF